jgi:hypothetical protein
MKETNSDNFEEFKEFALQNGFSKSINEPQEIAMNAQDVVYIDYNGIKLQLTTRENGLCLSVMGTQRPFITPVAGNAVAIYFI